MRTLIRSVFLVVSYRAATSRAIFAADFADLNHETGTNAALPSGGKPRSKDDIVPLIGLAYRYALPLYEVSRGRYELEFNPAHAGLSPRIVWWLLS